MSFGATTPIEVVVTHPELEASRTHAEKIRDALAEERFLRDVQIAQTLDFPTVGVEIDRERAGRLGVSVDDVTRSLVAATTSSRFTVANFWADPKTGISYNPQVQIPRRSSNRSRTGKHPISPRMRHDPAAQRRRDPTGTAVGTYGDQHGTVVSVTANLHDTTLGEAAS
jgi:hypothetical protein